MMMHNTQEIFRCTEENFDQEAQPGLSAKMRPYNSFFDRNLVGYFERPKVKRHLTQKGYILPMATTIEQFSRTQINQPAPNFSQIVKESLY